MFVVCLLYAWANTYFETFDVHITYHARRKTLINNFQNL